MIAPLCIIQARYGSTRLPGKMLLDLAGESLIARAWRVACESFGETNVVVAIPTGDADGPLGDELRRIGANVFAWDGPEADLLGRFTACANAYRWHPDTVVIRWTADDPFKDPALCRRVAAGERHPIEQSCEAFTLQMLRRANAMTSPAETDIREHLSRHPMLFAGDAPQCPDGAGWTIDSEEDYEAARQRLEKPSANTLGVSANATFSSGRRHFFDSAEIEGY